VEAPLVCPGCGAGGTPHERFCPRCGSPLVMASPAESRAEPSRPDSLRARARKVHAPYAEGELVRVAHARHQAEAEMLQALLLDAGVPSLVRRSGGFDVPDFLAAGPRDILVAASGVDVARDVLAEVEGPAPPDVNAPSSAAGASTSRGPGPQLTRMFAWLLLTLVLVSLGVAVGVAVLR